MALLQILPATPAHAALLTELCTTTFCETYEAHNTPENMKLFLAGAMTEEVIKAELADTANHHFIAWLDGEALGYVKLRANETPPTLADKNAIEIERLYVRQQYYSQKAGAALMLHSLQFAAANGYTTIWLGVWERNPRAIAFYTRFGYKPFGTHIFKLGEDEQTDVLVGRRV